MKSIILGGAAVSLVACSTQSIAQTAAPAPVASPAVEAIAAPAANNAVLRTGTEVALRLSEELTTQGKKLRVGNRFRLEMAEPVIVQGMTVIPAGSPAVGDYRRAE